MPRGLECNATATTTTTRFLDVLDRPRFTSLVHRCMRMRFVKTRGTRECVLFFFLVVVAPCCLVHFVLARSLALVSRLFQRLHVVGFRSILPVISHASCFSPACYRSGLSLTHLRHLALSRLRVHLRVLRAYARLSARGASAVAVLVLRVQFFASLPFVLILLGLLVSLCLCWCYIQQDRHKQ